MAKEVKNEEEKKQKESDSFSFAEFNEQILLEVNDMYNKVGNESDDESYFDSTKVKNVLNLRNIAESLKEKLGMVNAKATVLVIGNISAGKSTFVNWFAQEAIQKTGMAIETSGFSIIRGGKHLSTLEGPSNLLLNPHLAELVNKHKGLMENLSTKICTYSTKTKKGWKIKMLDIIDSPGLADGELEYPFDVEQVILDFASTADLILVFFDPIGQALGKRMLNVVKSIHDKQPDKVRLCLTKVDDVRTEEERIKIMCQTTQTITSKIHSRHGFDLIPIYIPGAKDGTYLLDSMHNDALLKHPADGWNDGTLTSYWLSSE